MKFLAFLLLLSLGVVLSNGPWEDYIENSLINFDDTESEKNYINACESAAIVSNSDGTIWASSSNFNLGEYEVEIDNNDMAGVEKVKINEFKNLMDVFNNKGVSSMVGGVRLNKQKFMVAFFDSGSQILSLKKSQGGGFVAKTNTAFVIVTYNTNNKTIINKKTKIPQNPGISSLVVEAFQKYLIANNL